MTERTECLGKRSFERFGASVTTQVEQFESMALSQALLPGMAKKAQLDQISLPQFDQSVLMLDIAAPGSDALLTPLSESTSPCHPFDPAEVPTISTFGTTPRLDFELDTDTDMFPASPVSLSTSPTQAQCLDPTTLLLSQPAMPMSIIPAAIMGLTTTAPCVGVVDGTTLQTPSCLVPLVGRDYLSLGSLNATSLSGRIMAEIKPRPLSSMEFAESWLPTLSTEPEASAEPVAQTEMTYSDSRSSFDLVSNPDAASIHPLDVDHNSIRSHQASMPTSPRTLESPGLPMVLESPKEEDLVPQQVVRKRPSFAEKLRKVFITKSPHGKDSCSTSSASLSSTSSTPSDNNMSPPSAAASSSSSSSSSSSLTSSSSNALGTDLNQQQSQQSQRHTSQSMEGMVYTKDSCGSTSASQVFVDQHRGSVSSTSSGDTSTTTATTTSESQGGVQSTPGTSPDLSPSGSPKLQQRSVLDTLNQTTTSDNTPPRIVKKRLSFASISNFFTSRAGIGHFRSDSQGSAARQQRSCSVPNVEYQPESKKRQLSGFRRRHSLNDLHIGQPVLIPVAEKPAVIVPPWDKDRSSALAAEAAKACAAFEKIAKRDSKPIMGVFSTPNHVLGDQIQLVGAMPTPTPAPGSAGAPALPRLRSAMAHRPTHAKRLSSSGNSVRRKTHSRQSSVRSHLSFVRHQSHHSHTHTQSHTHCHHDFNDPIPQSTSPVALSPSGSFVHPSSSSSMSSLTSHYHDGRPDSQVAYDNMGQVSTHSPIQGSCSIQGSQSVFESDSVILEHRQPLDSSLPSNGSYQDSAAYYSQHHHHHHHHHHHQVPSSYTPSSLHQTHSQQSPLTASYSNSSCSSSSTSLGHIPGHYHKQQLSQSQYLHHNVHAAYQRPPRQLQFSTEMPSVHATFTAEQYDRTSDSHITASRLTPAMAQKIKVELNQFKSQEMIVHEDSRIYTHFFA